MSRVIQRVEGNEVGKEDKMTKRKQAQIKRARKALKEVVSILCTGSEAASGLWGILTALRGPDDGDNSVKEMTTARIRRAIGMKSHRNIPATVSTHGTFSTVSTTARGDSDEHFQRHVRMAIDGARYLGLK